MKAKKVYENIEFERGRDPKATLGVGGINFQKMFDELLDEWMDTVKGSIVGKTISGEFTKYLGVVRYQMQKESGPMTVKVVSAENPRPSTGENMSLHWGIEFEGEDGFKYSMRLGQKITIEK